MILRRTFHFEAAHWLPMVPEGHKCGRMHGHSYAVEIHISGPVRDDGMVLDFAEIKAAWQPLQAALDHRPVTIAQGDARAILQPDGEVREA